MSEYTVKNPATNQTITFKWNDPVPPTDADLDAIFAEAGPQTTPASRGTGAPAVEPSALGFAKNVLSSGMEFGKDIASSVMNPKDTITGLATAVRNPGLTGNLIREAAMKRYGSVDAFLKTLYEDPVGAASDASIVLGGAGMAAKGVGALKSARAIGAMSEALNPLAVPAKGMAEGGRAAYGAAINPSRRIKRGFPGAIDEGYSRNVLPTERGLATTEAALEGSAAKTQTLLKEADAAGAPGVNVKAQIVPSLKESAVKAGERYKLGLPDERGAVSERATALGKRNSQPIPLTKANVLKREAQSLADSAFRAQERGALIKDLDALNNKNVAQAYRKAIEVNAASVGVHGVAESNRQTQSLIGLAQALEDATQQPSRLTHLMATLGGVGGGLAGGTGVGAAAYAAGRVATAKPVMAGAGLAVGKSAWVARNAQIMRALAVLASANGERATEQDQAGQ